MYLALRFLQRFFCLLPHRVAVGLGEWLGRLWYALDGRHRRVAKSSLVNAYPAWSHTRMCHMARQVFVHVARVLVDFLRLPRYADADYRARWVSVVGEEHLRKAHARGSGVILLSAHWGNWELMGLVCAVLGYQVSAIARKVGPRCVTRLINELRGVTGMRVLDKMQAARPTFTALKAGECVGILADQSDAVTGIPATFFGRACATTPALASFALKTGAAIVPAMCPLLPDGRYVARFDEPIDPLQTGDGERDVAELTQRVTSYIERCVRERPEQWFWVHRRWKLFDHGQLHKDFRYVETVLVKAPNWLGDIVMALPAFEYLKAAMPGVRITALVKAPLGDVLRACPHVDEVIEYSHRRGLRGVLDAVRTVRRVRRRYFSAAVLLPNSLSSALWMAMARIPGRVGARGQWRRWLLTHPVARRPKDMHQGDYYLRVVSRLAHAGPPKALHLPVRELDAAWAVRFLRERGLNSGAQIVGLNPGAAYGPAKRWLPERFAEVGRRLRDECGAEVLVFGSDADAEVVGAVVEQIGRGAHNLAGRTRLGELAALLARCGVLVTNDTGPMHLAGAVGTRVVAVFGSTSPERSSPSGAVTVIQQKGDCPPCFRRECPTDLRCMTSITADEVFDAASAYLGKRH